MGIQGKLKWVPPRTVETLEPLAAACVALPIFTTDIQAE